jgi:hypothetical protein
VGNWISVYSVEPARLDAAIASKSDAEFDKVLAASPELATDDGKRGFVRRLIDGGFSRGEQPDGGATVSAFQAICRACASHRATVEIYVDENLFPEIWNFVWGAAETPQGLPMSKHGSPAVGFWDAKSVGNQIEVFKKLDRTALADRNKGQRYDAEILELLAVLRGAQSEGRGVYVFFNE